MQIGIGIGPGFVPGKGRKGGSPAFDPDAQAQINRIEAAGGVIESPDLLDADVKLIKSLGLYNNWKYAIDPVCGIAERVDGADTFIPKIYDYSSAKTGGIYADTANGNAIEQPKKGTLNSQTALDFDGIDDRLVNVDDISFPNGTESFSVAVYAQDFAASDAFGQMIDKYSPVIAGFQFGNYDTDKIRAFIDTGFSNSPYNNVQIIVSGNRNTSNLCQGFLNEIQISTQTISGDPIGKSLGKILNAVSSNYAKGLLQKNWDFNIIPTQDKINQIYAYLKAQKEVPY